VTEEWLFSMPFGSIRNWNELKRIFLEKYFLASHATNIRKEILLYNWELLFIYLFLAIFAKYYSLVLVLILVVFFVLFAEYKPPPNP
jgi:hypothetical protein